MTEHVKIMLETLRCKEYRKKRISEFWDLPGFNDKNEFEQSTWMMEAMLEKQQPVILDRDIFGFNRYLIDRPGQDARSHTIIDGEKFFERYSNISPAYWLLIDRGLDSVISKLDRKTEDAEGERKVAQLVKLFILSGGHQLQLNTLNRETLLQAQQHPENHPNLVVRVWGWSGYFCELDKVFQDHILSRAQYSP